jgi:hypothetical protein
VRYAYCIHRLVSHSQLSVLSSGQLHYNIQRSENCWREAKGARGIFFSCPHILKF